MRTDEAQPYIYQPMPMNDPYPYAVAGYRDSVIQGLTKNEAETILTVLKSFITLEKHARGTK